MASENDKAEEERKMISCVFICLLAGVIDVDSVNDKMMWRRSYCHVAFVL